MCAHVQEDIFGRSFDLTDPAQMEEFVSSGAAEKCRIPVCKAVRIAGRMILEERQ
jgi:hypothetical protein